MYKLHLIRNELGTNDNVVMVKTVEQRHFPGRNKDGYSHIVNFMVAPKKGLYTGKELQDFMMGLVPDVEPTDMNRFHELSDMLDFGKLYFNEKIGEERILKKQTITDPSLKILSGSNDGKRTEEYTKDYRRRIIVSPFPDEKFTLDVLAKKVGMNGVSLMDLRDYRPGIFKGLIGKRFF